MKESEILARLAAARRRELDDAWNDLTSGGSGASCGAASAACESVPNLWEGPDVRAVIRRHPFVAVGAGLAAGVAAGGLILKRGRLGRVAAFAVRKLARVSGSVAVLVLRRVLSEARGGGTASNGVRSNGFSGRD
jgi:hypothetical protein